MKFVDIWNWLVDNIEVIYKIFIMLQLFILNDENMEINKEVLGDLEDFDDETIY